jgi:RNA polymerase sigma factor (sigma-70 family)
VAGEPGAARRTLDQLYPPLAPAVQAWAHLRLGPRLRQELSPEDLAQEIWLRALEALPGWSPERCSFRAWLFAVGKRVLLELQRRVLRHAPEQAAAGSTTRLRALDEVPLEVTSLTRRVARDEQLRQFVARLDQLDEVERMTIVHCGFEELSLGDAAQRLGESYDATAKRWQRLRERLRSWSLPPELVAGV